MNPVEMEMIIGDNLTYERISIMEELKRIRSKITYLKIWMWRIY